MITAVDTDEKFVKTRADCNRENPVSGRTLKIYKRARLSKGKIFTSGNVGLCALSIYNSNNCDTSRNASELLGFFFSLLYLLAAFVRTRSAAVAFPLATLIRAVPRVETSGLCEARSANRAVSLSVTERIKFRIAFHALLCHILETIRFNSSLAAQEIDEPLVYIYIFFFIQFARRRNAAVISQVTFAIAK